jgi:hypothetical protein
LVQTKEATGAQTGHLSVLVSEKGGGVDGRDVIRLKAEASKLG